MIKDSFCRQGKQYIYPKFLYTDVLSHLDKAVR